MNAFNRLLAISLFVFLAVVGAIITWSLADPDHIPALHLQHDIRALLERVAVHSGSSAQDPAFWIARLGALGATFLAVMLFFLELKTLRGPRSLVLYAGEGGATMVSYATIGELARWAGEGTPGVEGMPSTRVRRKGKGVLVSGVALLNPMENAQEALPVLQQKIQWRVSHALGLPVEVSLRSRFARQRTDRMVR